MLVFNKNKIFYPPVVSDCPDYWISNQNDASDNYIENVVLKTILNLATK